MKTDTKYAELVRRAAAALHPSTPSYEDAEKHLRRIARELATAPEIAKMLFDTMSGPPPVTGDWAQIGALFRGFVMDARDPRGLGLVPYGNGRDWERAALAVDAHEQADAIVAVLEEQNKKHYFVGIAAALYAGKRVRPALTALYNRTFSTSQQWVAVAIAIARDPDDAAWFKSLPNSGEYANAKRLHVALTSTKPKERIDAIDKLTKTIEKQTFYGTLIGLCLLLDSDVPETVERAALALATHAKKGIDSKQETEHHAIFLRFARAAVQRGVTAEARRSLDEVVAKIPRATPLGAGSVVTGNLGPLPVKPPKPKKPATPSPHAAVTSDDDDIVREILANPDDDAPRLVLADRLMDRGDPRGEFILIQCALGRRIEGARGYVPQVHGATGAHREWLEREGYITKEVPNRAELEAREAVLYKKHLKHWLEPVRAFIRTWSWRRGFLYVVDAPAGAFLDGAATLLAAHPVAVNLEKLDKAAFARLRTAPLQPLRSLSVTGIRPKEVDSFLGENLQGLERLSFVASPLGDAGMTRLATDSHLRSLRILRLPGSELGDPGLRALVDSPLFANLEMLDLQNTEITDAGLRALVESKNLPRLRHVLISRGSGLPEYDPDVLAALEERLARARSLA